MADQSLTEFFLEIADAIREVEGSSGDIPAPEFPDRIRNLSASSGVDASGLKASIAAAEAAKSTAKVQGQGDYDFGTMVSTQESIEQITAAIAKAQAAYDVYGTETVYQEDIDAAKRELDAALETFRSSLVELTADLSGFQAQSERYAGLKADVTVSADGKDVAFGSLWVTQSEQSTADAALETAQGAVGSATKQSQVDAAVATLKSAIDTYESARKTASASYTALDAAIQAANAAKADVQTSDSEGSDLPAGSSYVTTQQMATFNAAIEAAQTARSSATTQNQLDAATSALTAATATFTSQIKQNVSIYGVSFPSFPATTKGVRTDAAANFGDVQPAANNGSGSSPFDNIDPWKSMVPEDRVGGRMVPIKKFYYKLSQNGKGVDVQIATGPMDGFTISPAHMDRNDGKGERDVVYVGRYHCAASTFKSTSGAQPANNQNKATLYANCHNVGDNYYMMDFATRFTLWLLYLVETAEWNSQKLIGGGCSTGNSIMSMGYTDGMGYCTGTTAATIAATTYGGTQYRNIEGLWDNVYDIISGCYNASNGLNLITDAAHLGDASGGKTVGVPANGWVGELKVSETGGYPMFYNANTSGGSDSAGTCDYWGFSSGYPVVFVGGGYGQNTNHGMFYVNYTAASNANASRGCRLLELP